MNIFTRTLLTLATVQLHLHLSTASLLPTSTFRITLYDAPLTDQAQVGRNFIIAEDILDPKNGVVSAKFDDSLNKTGWGVLDVFTNEKFADDRQAYGAGFAEGLLTARHIYTTVVNLEDATFGHRSGGAKAAVAGFFTEQEEWTREQVAAHKEDEFWVQIGLVQAQYDGLRAGYGEAVKRGVVPALDKFAFRMVNSIGDLFDLVPALSKADRFNRDELSFEEAIRVHVEQGHCSAIIKPTPLFDDIFFSHSSWFTYKNTNRIFKHYQFNFNAKSTHAKRVSFSSYPGFLSSLDDFYMMSSGLMMTQTTNGILDQSVYDHNISPRSLLAWQRVRAACVMARSGKEYHDVMKTHYSGTYANQYMILNLNLFEPRKPLKSGLLYVLEEMPGLIVGDDVTHILARGYWPSYNVPYWPEIYNRSGYVEMSDKYGNAFSYQLAPRATIFRRDQSTVHDIKSLKTLMRYNNFKADPLSFDNPEFAICSRLDLGHMKKPSGCYDTKVTSFKSGALQGKAEIINGPTRSINKGNLPPFSWTQFKSQRHLGLPGTYTFDFVSTQPYDWNKRGLRIQKNSDISETS